MAEPATPTGFNRPAFEDLLARVRADYSANIEGGDAFLDQGVLPRLAEMDAQAAHALHAHLDWAARQAMPLHAAGDWLEGWAKVWNIQRKAPTAAGGEVTFAGDDDTVVPVEAEMKRADGAVFAVTDGGTVAGGTVTVTVEALEAQAAGNTSAGVTLALSSPIAGLESQGTVGAAGLIGGADAEADEALRARILDRIALPPHGGATFDYSTWVLEVPGVTRAWISPKELGTGTVTIRFMMDEVQSANDGIPQGDGAPTYSGDLKTVFDYIDDPTRRPIAAEVFVVAPAPVALDVTITGLAPDTAEVRAAIEAELKDMLLRRAEPGGTIYLSWIWESVSIASGEDSHAITAPAADVEHDTGEIAILGTVSYA